MPASFRTAAPQTRRTLQARSLRARWSQARRLRAAVLLCAPLVAAAGCSDSTTDPYNLAGTYALAGVSGQSLPYTTADARYTYITTDGTLYLGSDRTYRIEVNSRIVDRQTNLAQSVTDVGTGTYTLSGSSLTAYPDASSDPEFDQTTTGTVSGSTVSIDVFTFVRQ